MTKKFRPIILAGGVGKRLWPLSTESNPKQFIPIFQDLSLFDLTIQRVNKKNLFKTPIVVTTKRYMNKILASTERTGIENKLIILEPEGRNTCPAATLAVALSMDKNKDDNFIVMPSDHYISMNKRFYDSCKLISKKIEKNHLFLFGVNPDFPSSQFGYILASKGGSVVEIEKFVEKPKFEKAKSLFEQEDVYWNAGIFAFKGDWFIKEIKRKNKNLLEKVLKSISLGKYQGNVFMPHNDSFKQIEDISIDKAVVERSKKILMTELKAGWLDLGSWTALTAFHTDPSSPFSLSQRSSEARIEKPWGFFDVLMQSSSSKVKLIEVKAGQKLSLQQHKYRSETWHVIKGKAKVTRGKEKFTLELGDSVIIEKNQIHSLENSEDNPLQIIEIQTGEYLGEDDIVRIEDIYGRAGLH